MKELAGHVRDCRPAPSGNSKKVILDDGRFFYIDKNESIEVGKYVVAQAELYQSRGYSGAGRYFSKNYSVSD